MTHNIRGNRDDFDLMISQFGPLRMSVGVAQESLDVTVAVFGTLTWGTLGALGISAQMYQLHLFANS